MRSSQPGSRRSAAGSLPLLAATVALTLVGIAFWAKGLNVLLRAEDGAADLMRRWIETRYVWKGVDPLQVASGALPVDPALGMPDGPNYPPWSFLQAMLFTWPGQGAVRWYYAAWQVGLMAALLLVVRRVLLRERLFPVGADVRRLLLASVFAIGAICTNTGTGNYALLIVALLAGMLAVLQEEDAGGKPTWKQEILLGSLFALAMIKPIIPPPFGLVLLFLGRWRAVAVAACWLVAASLIVWPLVHVDPLTITREMLQAGQQQLVVPESLTSWVQALGVPAKWVTPLTALVGLLPFVPLIGYMSRRHLLTAFALAAVAGRLWAYHRTYDDVMLAFLLVLFGVQGYGAKADRTARVMFWLCGATLWLPASLLTRFEALKPAFLLFWFAAGFVAYALTRRRVAEEAAAAAEGATAAPLAAPAPGSV